MTKPQKGSLLVAEVALTGDTSFSRALIFLVEHNAQSGSVGFVLNKASEYTLADLIPGITDDFQIYNGGPVEKENIYFLHTLPNLLPKSIEISNGVYWGGDFEVLQSELIKGNISPNKIKFFLGYSGWYPSQLEEEIKSNSWIVTRNEWNIFEENNADTWKEKLRGLGGNYLIWANSPENPSHN